MPPYEIEEVHIHPHDYGGVYMHTYPSLHGRYGDFIIKIGENIVFFQDDSPALQEVVRVAFEEGSGATSVHVKKAEIIVHMRGATEQQRNRMIDAIAEAMRALTPRPKVTATYIAP